MEYIAADKDRLDEIVYKHYGTLEVFAMVLKENARLKTLLRDKDIVILPDITAPTIKEEELW